MSTVISVAIVAVVAISFYALHKKGDVKASFTLYPFAFTFQAKDRKVAQFGPRKRKTH